MSMTRTASPTSRPSSGRTRLLMLAAAIMLAIAVAAIAWTIGTSTVPNADDAAAARELTYEQSWQDARGAAYQPAYDAAWASSSVTGAAAGRTEGAAAGAAAARRAAR